MLSEVEEKSSKKNPNKKGTSKKAADKAGDSAAAPAKEESTKSEAKSSAKGAKASTKGAKSFEATATAAVAASNAGASSGGAASPVAEQALAKLLASGGNGEGAAKFIEVKKQKGKEAEGKFSLELTPAGTELHKQYGRAYAIAEEKGPMDREVTEIMTDLAAKWSSYPGVLENVINEAIESGETAKGADAARAAAAEWGALLAKAGVKSVREVAVAGDAGSLLVQLLANYEFALERNNELPEALEVGILTRELDLADPENVLSAIINLYIRTGDPMSALRALEPLQDSLAPFVLYGRALAYFALGQRENASGAIQVALRAWPDVARALTREWKGGTPMPKPGEAVSELQVLYGYYEVFGSTWKSVDGAIEWLREEDRNFQRTGAKPQRYIGLTRSGYRTDSHGNVVHQSGEQKQTDEERAQEQAELIRKGQLIGEDEFVRFYEVRPNEYVYQLTERGEELEEAHNELYRTDMKLGARIDAIHEMLKEWPGHANAAIALARYYGQRERFEEAVELLEPVIFDLQKFWPDDLVGNGRITDEWPGNKPMLSAYAYMILDCAESGDNASAKAFADDYLLINPGDNLGVRQKTIELYIEDNDYTTALRLINEAADQMSAYNLFGRALIGYSVKANDAEKALQNAVESRPLVWREMYSDKHRMPHNYNPSFVHYFSPEEAYNYQQGWSGLWLKKYGALAWLKKEGRKYLKS